MAADDAGVDAALVVTPYYNRPSQAGIEAHFRAIAAAARLPVIAYDIPKRTGREVSRHAARAGRRTASSPGSRTLPVPRRLRPP